MTNTSGPVVVIGGGGMGHCVLDIIDDINRAGGRVEVVGVVADPPPDLDLLNRRDVPFLGSVAEIERLPADVGYVIGIGSGGARQKIDARLRSSGRPSPTLVHPNVHQGFGVELGPGSVICSHVSVENFVSLGRHVHVNQNSTVGHGSRLADYVTVSPLVAISGDVKAGEAAFLGTNCSVREKLTVGAGATIGMGAAVVSDVPDGLTVVGVPAREKVPDGWPLGQD
jgi:sugar O-acyltransferase (sialic acid O-acetyltransferase NeuD family)